MEKGALFIDYENVYYYLKNTYKDPPELGTHTAAIIRALRGHLEEKEALHPIITNAYADFERLGAGSLGTLYLMGIQTRNVMGTGHKNAADMQMCIDLLQILYTRPDISCFILLAGDRDYIPVVQHLKRQGRRVIVSAFRDTLSGDLREIIGEGSFLDIAPLMAQDVREKLESHKAVESIASPRSGQPQPHIVGKISLVEPAVTNVRPPKTKAIPVEIKSPATAAGDIKKELPENAEDCLDNIFKYIEETGYKEPGMTPLLRYLTDQMPLLANWERKELIALLERRGVITIASRPGYDYPFSVVQLNKNHPMVQERMV